MEKGKRIIALGFFDGVHRGHRALLDACCALAREKGLEAAALTFDAHPESLTQGKAPALIKTNSDRVMLLRQLGIGPVYTIHFDKETMSMPWQDFFRLLVEDFGAAGIVCGDDFRFGYKGQGNAAKLQAACEAAGIPCRIVPEQTLDGIRVSSTYIRQLIQQGEMEKAVEFMGHPHILTGQVVSGRRLGRTIGVPTANLLLPEGILVPKFGVYACMAEVDSVKYPAVTNIGTRPTVGGHRVTVEPWILDFNEDIYGKNITLEFYKFLRPEEKFPSLEALRRALDTDAATVRQFFLRGNV